MSQDLVAGKIWERPPARENVLKYGLKQGLLVHSEQIVKGGG